MEKTHWQDHWQEGGQDIDTIGKNLIEKLTDNFVEKLFDKSMEKYMHWVYDKVYYNSFTRSPKSSVTS